MSDIAIPDRVRGRTSTNTCQVKTVKQTQVISNNYTVSFNRNVRATIKVGHNS